MIKKFAFLLICFQLTACTELQNVVGALGTVTELSQSQIGQGLKEALNIGIGKGSDRLSNVNGYLQSPYKILLPAEALKVTEKLQKIPGFDKVEANIVEKINRGAEDAAKKAKPIFVDAIRSMSIQDATSILMGEKNAATKFLNKATYNKLYQEFQPVIVNSLNKKGALNYWSDLVNKYNKIPFVTKMNPSLEDHITNKALDGLFAMVAKEELNIRQNVSARTSDLLKQVFAKQDKG